MTDTADGQATGPHLGVAVGPLPGVVRTRVVALASDALGRVPAEHLPPSLKRLAAFAPQRRAKLAGNQIAGALESDEIFREHLATQVRVAVPELAAALESGVRPAAADPVEVAAVAYLLRPEGWADLVAGAADRAGTEHAVVASQEVADQAERLRRRLEAVAEAQKAEKERHRSQVAELKAANMELRHKVGELRGRTRSAETAAAVAEESAATASAATTAALAAAEAETRRLRTRVDELEQQLARLRRTERVERGAEALKARLLLDTLLESAQGLRRELALPAVHGAPADAVEAHVAGQGARVSTGSGSLASDDPQLLDQLLTLPRVHLIVDGYNVTKSAWPEMALDRQRDRLLAGVAPLAARSGAEVTVVFDAAETSDRPLVNRPRGVRVLYSPVGVIADDVIRDLVSAEPRGRPLIVVSSDQEVVADVVRAGARAVAATALSRLISRT